MTGATTRTPDASPSVHVRKTRPSSSAAITSPRRSDIGPNAALTMAATNAQATRASTSNTRSSSPRPPVRRRNTRAAITSASVFPTVWPSDGPERRRKVPEQEIADHDARPQPNAVQEQHGEAHARRRPQGRHRTVEIGELEADPSRQVIGPGEQRDGTSVQHDAAVPGPAQRRDPSAHAVAALVRASSKRCRHAPRAESKGARPGSGLGLLHHRAAAATATRLGGGEHARRPEELDACGSADLGRGGERVAAC